MIGDKNRGFEYEAGFGIVPSFKTEMSQGFRYHRLVEAAMDDPDIRSFTRMKGGIMEATQRDGKGESILTALVRRIGPSSFGHLPWVTGENRKSHLKCIQKKLTILDDLLFLGVPPDSAASSGETALMICSGSPDLLEFVERLVGAGAAFEPVDDPRCTPLFIALAARNLDCARFLVKHGAPVAPAFEQGDWLDEQSVSLLDELRPSEDTLLSWIPELARAGRTHHLLTWSGLSGKIRTSLAFGLS